MSHSYDLSYKDVTDDQIDDLIKRCVASKYREVFLDGNQIRDEGASKLASYIAHSKHIETMGLSDNEIGDEGCRQLLDAMGANPRVKKMYVGGNANVQDKTLVKAIHGLALARTASERQAKAVRDVIALLESGEKPDGGAKGAPASRRLELNNNPMVGTLWDELVAALGSCKDPSLVTALNLGYCGLTGGAGVQLGKVLAEPGRLLLRELCLDGNELGDADARALSRALRTQTRLAQLNLDDNLIGDEGAQALFDALQERMSGGHGDAASSAASSESSSSSGGRSSTSSFVTNMKQPAMGPAAAAAASGTADDRRAPTPQPQHCKVFLGGNEVSPGLLSALSRFTAAREADAMQRQLAERIQRLTSSMDPAELDRLRQTFDDCDRDGDGLVRVSRLAKLFARLGKTVAKQSDIDVLVGRCSRKMLDTGIVDFPTFVLVYQLWRDECDPEVVLRRLFADHCQQSESDVMHLSGLKEALVAQDKRVPPQTALERIVAQISPNLVLNYQQFYDLMQCWDYIAKNSLKICVS